MEKTDSKSNLIIKFEIDKTIYLLETVYRNMVQRKLTKEEIEKQKEEQKMRAKASRAARRSGKSVKTEGKVSKSKAKTKETRSQKKVATVNKSRY